MEFVIFLLFYTFILFIFILQKISTWINKHNKEFRNNFFLFLQCCYAVLLLELISRLQAIIMSLQPRNNMENWKEFHLPWIYNRSAEIKNNSIKKKKYKGKVWKEEKW
jgi:hypothetical protein